MRDLTDKIHLMLESCDLNHGLGVEKPQAVDYITQTLGDGGQLRIPICAECADALMCTEEERWVLLYCLSCLSSQWIDKSVSRRLYHYEKGERIKWMRECPKCDGEK